MDLLDIASARTLIETADSPVIKHGGQSSSKALNKINENLRTDLLAIGERVDDVDAKLDLATEIFLIQASQIQAAAAGISSALAGVLDLMSNNTNRKAIVDMYSADYKSTIGLPPSLVPSISTVYGQATLGIRGAPDEKLVAVDTEGAVWIPDTSVIRYACSGDMAQPEFDTFLTDDNYRRALDKRNDTAWIRSRANPGTTERYIWVLVEVPIETLTDTLSNTITLHPFPTFAHNLVSLSYQDYNGTWWPVDLSYQPGYSAPTGEVTQFGNARFFIEPAYVARLLICVDGAADALFGFAHIGLSMTEFESESRLVFDLSTLIKAVGAAPIAGDTVLGGRNPAELALITPVIDGASGTITYELTQHISGATPVVTHLETSW